MATARSRWYPWWINAFCGALKENDTDTFNGEVFHSCEVVDELFGTEVKHLQGFQVYSVCVCVWGANCT